MKATKIGGSHQTMSGLLIYNPIKITIVIKNMCKGLNSLYLDGHPTLNFGNPNNKYIKPYCKVDDHPDRKTRGVWTPAHTSSTAQGGGGSFKNKKRIGDWLL